MTHDIDISKRKNLRTLVNSKEKIIALEGGSGCFDPNQVVIVKGGSKPISKVNLGDEVLSYNLGELKREWKKVKTTFKYENRKKCIKLNLENGKEIIGTEEHKIYYKGTWESLKHIVSLLDERNMENNTRI